MNAAMNMDNEKSELIQRIKNDSHLSRSFRAVGFHYSGKKPSHPKQCRFLGFLAPSESLLDILSQDEVGFCIEENCNSFNVLEEKFVHFVAHTNLLMHKYAICYKPLEHSAEVRRNKIKRENDFLGFLRPSDDIYELFNEHKVEFNLVPKKRTKEMFIELIRKTNNNESDELSEKENMDTLTDEESETKNDPDWSENSNDSGTEMMEEDQKTKDDENISDYELIRLQNIQERRQFLVQMGLIKDRKKIEKKTLKVKIVKFNGVNKKKKYPIRRSIRLSNGTSDFLSLSYDDADSENESESQVKKNRVTRPNTYGAIEGVAIGEWWGSRLECNAAGIHRPTVAGIHPGPKGAYSVVLSGGYDDDVDNGTSFTYTGSGGRDLKGTKINPKNLRTAPQTKNQTLNMGNAALVYSCDNHIPVRVVRGYKLKSHYAPDEGYRYDGLYEIEKWWLSEGLSGFLTYKFLFKRCENQDPPPWILEMDETRSEDN